MPSGCPGAVGSIHLIVPPYLAPACSVAEDIGGAIPGPVADGETVADGFAAVVLEVAGGAAGAAEVGNEDVVGEAAVAAGVDWSLHPVMINEQINRTARGISIFLMLTFSSLNFGP